MAVFGTPEQGKCADKARQRDYHTSVNLPGHFGFTVTEKVQFVSVRFVNLVALGCGTSKKQSIFRFV